jgi:hypothetical protein
VAKVSSTARAVRQEMVMRENVTNMVAGSRWGVGVVGDATTTSQGAGILG